MRRRYRRETYLRQQRRRAKRRRLILVCSLFLLLSATAWTTVKSPSEPPTSPLAAAQQIKSQEAIAHEPPLTAEPIWPEHVAGSAIGAENYGVIATEGDENPRPTASIAKVITALAILEKHPLEPGEHGPEIVMTEKDEEIYNHYVAHNGTVTIVESGATFTEYEALEAMLLPSSNNMADSAAIWAFGSLEEYREYANDMVKRLGMTNTTVGADASGLDPSTTSTTKDLILLGEAALKNPIIAEIVAKDQAEIPLSGKVPNYNTLVKEHGFTGLKPGASIEAGETLLFSAKHEINGEEVELIGVVLGTEDGYSPQDSALQIMESTKKTLTQSSKTK